MFWRRLLASCALIVLLLASIGAQTPEDQSASDQLERQQKALELKKELERKTFALLDEIINSAATLKLPENRALVLSSAADLIWTRDEKRARSLFKDALNNLNSIAIKFDPKMSEEQRRSYQMVAQQRKEILQMIARRDADLALESLRASRAQVFSAGAAGKGSQQASEDLRLEQSLAIQIAANDPKRAFQMAEDSLSKGISFELLHLLTRLNDKDTELAGRFTDDIVNKLRSENLATNQEAAWFAAVLLRTGIQTEDDGVFSGLSFAGGGRMQFKLNEAQLRDLLEMVTTAALGATPNPSLFTFLPALMPEIEKRMPERAPALRRRIAESVRAIDPQERMYFEYQELTQRGTIEALLEAAAKAPDKARLMLYEQAAWKALNKGDAERARQIVNDHITDTPTRDRMLENFDRMSLWSAMRKDKLDEVRQKLARLKSKEERASILIQLAWGATVKKDRKLALELLDEALPFINFKPKNDSQLHLLLQVVRIYALVEPARAFEMIESLVDQANDLLSAASVLSGFFLPSGIFRKGEMVLPPGYSNVSMRFRQFGKELAALALFNFERTKAAADKLQRNEARIMARLFIAQGVLSEQLGSGVALYESGMAVGY
ncbi:MAG: hypothetical protein QOH25_525 [Acidobacteriota bacterium]|jgi:hypothetical protein|nr:hypothetical protein [Acidobacteriota bacterium]